MNANEVEKGNDFFMGKNSMYVSTFMDQSTTWKSGVKERKSSYYFTKKNLNGSIKICHKQKIKQTATKSSEKIVQFA